MCLSDLEFDYINPFDTAKRINKVIELEFVIHAGMTVLLLLCGVWLMFFINLPLLYLHARLYLRRQHLVDVTEIFNHLDYEKTYRLLKLGFYLVLLLVVIYRCSILLITPQFLIEIAIENCCYTCCLSKGISIACMLVAINKYIFTPYQCWPDFQLV
jgi:hypothetical protein